MISAAFIWEVKQYDEHFAALNEQIESACQAIPGFLGVETWVSEDGRRNQATYYWDSMDSLRQLMTHPQHLEAKRRYAEWYAGYRVVIAEIIRSYGDAGFVHLSDGLNAGTSHAAMPAA